MLPLMQERFDVRKDDKGWAVYDSTTGKPVVWKGVVQTGLNPQAAAELAEALSYLSERTLKDILG